MSNEEWMTSARILCELNRGVDLVVSDRRGLARGD
jgi:hypothetical protein